MLFAEVGNEKVKIKKAVVNKLINNLLFGNIKFDEEWTNKEIFDIFFS